MAQASKLDQTPPINSRFNNAGENDHEKRLSQYQLSPAEKEKIFDLRKDLENNTAQEKESFQDKGEFKQRFDQKYAELAQRNNVPTPENLPPGVRNRTLPKHQLMQMADHGVKQDHANKLNGFQNNYRSGVNDVLKDASNQGRGPKPQENQRDQNRDRNSTPTQDFNRANDNDRDRDR